MDQVPEFSTGIVSDGVCEHWLVSRWGYLSTASLGYRRDKWDPCFDVADSRLVWPLFPGMPVQFSRRPVLDCGGGRLDLGEV